MHATIDRLRNTPAPRSSQVDRAFAAFAALWEERLANGWSPPDGSPFPWAMVRFSLAALLPGFRTLRAAPERGGSSPVAALVLAGNTPLLAWPALHAALRAGCTVFVKMSRGETLWPRLFQDTLASVDAELAARIVLEVWPGDDTRTIALVQAADAVVAYGSDATLAVLRQNLSPETPFFGYGHAVSIGILQPGWSRDDLRGFARDVLMYGQGGCLSPHVFLEQLRPGDDYGMGIYGGKEFAALLMHEAEVLGVSPVTDATIAHAIRSARDMAFMEGLDAVLEDLRATVVCDYSSDVAPMPLPVGHGVVHIIPCSDLVHELPARLGVLRGRVSAAGIAGEISGELRTALLAERVSYLCQPGEMQTPPLDWHNGNRDLFAELRQIQARRGN